MPGNDIYALSFDRGDYIAAGIAAAVDDSNHVTAGLMPIQGSLIGIVIGGK